MNLETALAAYTKHLSDDFDHWSKPSEFRQKHVWLAEPGRSYIKIVQNYASASGRHEGGSAHSFIVLKSPKGKNFQFGDILMAASYKAPATNFARGNIFDYDSYKSRARWSGVS